MIKIYAATSNKNKKRELAQILDGYDVVIPCEEGIAFSPEETGSTFYENSMIKARALWNIVHKPVIADDSGLCVDVLGGAPGIYSSRYAGKDFSFGRPDGIKIQQPEQNKLLIAHTNIVLASGEIDTSSFLNGERSCHYVCSIVFMLSLDHFYIAQEVMEGTLVPSIADAAGTGGFGYDPIVFLPQYNKTVAQISSKEKNAISHRGKAIKSIIPIIKNKVKKR